MEQYLPAFATLLKIYIFFFPWVHWCCTIWFVPTTNAQTENQIVLQNICMGRPYLQISQLSILFGATLPLFHLHFIPQPIKLFLQYFHHFHNLFLTQYLPNTYSRYDCIENNFGLHRHVMCNHQKSKFTIIAYWRDVTRITKFHVTCLNRSIYSESHCYNQNMPVGWSRASNRTNLRVYTVHDILCICKHVTQRPYHQQFCDMYTLKCSSVAIPSSQNKVLNFLQGLPAIMVLISIFTFLNFHQYLAPFAPTHHSLAHTKSIYPFIHLIHSATNELIKI